MTSAKVSTVQLGADLGVPTLSTGVESVKIAASVVSVSLAANTNYVSASATPSLISAGFTVAYIAAAAVAALDEIGFNKRFIDSVTSTDFVEKGYSKLVSSSASVADSTVKTAGKLLQETVTVVDVISIVLTAIRSFTDTAAATDARLITTGKLTEETLYATEAIYSKDTAKLLAHAVSAADAVTERSFSKAINDTFSLSDTKFFTVGTLYSDYYDVADSTELATTKLTEETLYATEAIYSKDTAKLLTDSAYATQYVEIVSTKQIEDNSGPSDSLFMGFDKAITDSASFLESGSVISQGYCDLTYFELDFVGAYSTFT